ncbi:PAS domain S-box protein [Argonema antarcticum]|uniref:PAS domain S-box protein n=1 Tax=Argonema antarcticum TaxID=2942763 RepID=UPI00201391A2|nr:PAS domain S-box protein [Argonema antarcticum]MCL1473744.1 PAS domain S-box protein [Argonema antarcticum A004/B2]
MPEFLRSFFAQGPFIPHGHCYLWKPGLVWLHIASDSAIALAYYSIPIVLFYFVQKRRDLPYSGIFLLFSAFIIFCGTTHIMEVWTLWHPDYWLSGVLKAFTAVLSGYTSIRLVSIIPQALALPSPAQLEVEIGERKLAEEALRKAYDEMESRVQERTAQLSQAIEQLQNEIAQKERTSQELRASEAQRKQAIEELRTTNQTLQTLIAASPLAIATINNDGNVTMWNPAAERLFGWSETEVLGKPLPIIPPEQQEEFRTIVQTELQGEEQTGLELRRQRKDGSPIDISLWTAPLFDGNGVVTGCIGLFVDISDKVRAEQALRESQQQLMAIMDNSPAVIFVKDTQSRYNLINRRFETLFHIDREEIKGKTQYDIFPYEIADKLRANDLKVLAAGTPLESEEVVLQDDGLHTYISVKFPLYNSSGVPYAICSISTDITDRKRVEETLRESEEQFRITFEQAAIGICHWGLNGEFIKVNQRFCDIVGYTEAELLKLSFEDITHPDDMADLTQFRSLIAGEIPTYSMEKRYLTPLGRIVWVNLTVSVVRSLAGEPKYEIAVIQDISDRKQAEEELKKSLKNSSDLKSALDQAAIVAITNRQGKITYVNDKFCELSKYSREEIVGQDHRIINSSYHSQEFIQNLWSTIKSGKIWKGEIRNKAKDGSLYWVNTTIVPLLGEGGKPLQYLAIRFDITDRKRAEEEQQKLIAVIESCSDFIGMATLDGHPIFLNEAGQNMVGIEGMEELKQSTLFDYFMPEDLAEFREEILPVVMAEGRWQGEFRFRHFKTGNSIPIYANVFSIKDSKTSQPIAIATITKDITEQKRAESELRQSEAKYRELATREALLNRLASQIRSSLDINTILETAVQEIRNMLQIDRCVFIWYRPEEGKSEEEKLIHPSGSWEFVQEARNLAFPSLLGHSVPVTALGLLAIKVFNKEITRVDNARALTDPVERRLFFSLSYTALLALPIHTKSGEIGIVSCSHSSGSRPWRDAEVELLQAVADQLAIAIDQAELYKQTRIAAVKAQEQATKLEQTLRELQQTQAHLVQSEKMSSLGQLVAGVAHEINNPVNFIYGNITPAKEYAEDLLKLLYLYQENYPNPVKQIQQEAEAIDLDFIKEDLPKIIDSMKIGADRIREIVLSLRNFSRLDESETKKVDIHEGIDSTLLILKNRLKAKTNRPDIQIIKEYGNLPLVECYAGQLNQVFMNILNNAIDALEEAAGQRGSGAEEKSKIQNPEIRIRTEINESDRAIVRIADNGPGMTEEVRQRIFDPFFTTKPVGSGTGLGMSISYQIIDKHKGQLACISAPGQGAEFVIQIPIQQQR